MILILVYGGSMGKVKEALCPELNEVDITTSDEDIIESRSDETFICSVCGEWTSSDDSCCDAGPSNHEYERDYER
jgi:hypothetical protein